jgi:hypothetical protein
MAHLVPALAQTPLIDNERVTVFSVKPVQPLIASLAARQDLIAVSLETATIGAVTMLAKSPSATPHVVTGDHAIIISLKDARVPPLKNTTKYPAAFAERPGIIKVLENARVIIWDYTWALHKATPMHFHDKDVVVVWLASGALESSEPDGRSVITEQRFGVPRFTPRGRVHKETLVEGNARAVIVELK